MTAHLQFIIIIIIIIIIIVIIIIIIINMEHWRNNADREVTVTLCPPQTPHGLERDRTQATVVVYLVYLTTLQQLLNSNHKLNQCATFNFHLLARRRRSQILLM